MRKTTQRGRCISVDSARHGPWTDERRGDDHRHPKRGRRRPLVLSVSRVSRLCHSGFFNTVLAYLLIRILPCDQPIRQLFISTPRWMAESVPRGSILSDVRFSKVPVRTSHVARPIRDSLNLARSFAVGIGSVRAT